jgi:hypothetical protein
MTPSDYSEDALVEKLAIAAKLAHLVRLNHSRVDYADKVQQLIETTTPAARTSSSSSRN